MPDSSDPRRETLTVLPVAKGTRTTQCLGEVGGGRDAAEELLAQIGIGKTDEVVDLQSLAGSAAGRSGDTIRI